MKQLFIVVIMILFTELCYAQEPDNVYSGLLADYVSGDKVNYSQLCNDERLNIYIDYLANTDPATSPGHGSDHSFFHTTCKSPERARFCNRVRSTFPLAKQGQTSVQETR